jgi:hypothetical protein
MRRTPFREWLAHRVEEIPDAGRLGLVIAQSGAAGISREQIEKILRISSTTLDDLLRDLLATGQVVMLQVNGQMVYRVAE